MEEGFVRISEGEGVGGRAAAQTAVGGELWGQHRDWGDVRDLKSPAGESRCVLQAQWSQDRFLVR